MYLNNKTVFLAGATGLVGTSIIQHLLNHCPDTKIRAVYNQTNPFIQNERITYIKTDLRDKQKCREAVMGCDCAIMAAANTGGSQQLVSEPWHQINDNLIMNAQLFEAFYFEKIMRVIYIGSATVYQEFDGPIKEEDLDLNQNPHPAYSGIAHVVRYLEKLSQFWHDFANMEIICVRAANIFGPYAKFNPKTSNFIPAIIRKAVNKMNPFEVWGSPDITRDVIYSEDFAKAIVMIMNHKQIGYDVFNIGSGTKTTVGDVVQWALKYSDHQTCTITYQNDKPTTIKFRSIDCSKAQTILGWQPDHSIEEGIQKTTQWWIKNQTRWTK